MGVQSVKADTDSSGNIDLSQVLDELGKRGIIQLLVEGTLFLIKGSTPILIIVFAGGAEIHSTFLKNNFVNELVLYYGACVSLFMTTVQFTFITKDIR